MEASSPVIPENLSTDRNLRDRSICFQIISSDQDLILWSSDPLSQAADVSQENWFHKSLYAFPPICLIPMVMPDLNGQSTYDDPCNSSLAITTVVPRSNENVYTTTNFIDMEERSLKKIQRQKFIPLSKTKL